MAGKVWAMAENGGCRCPKKLPPSGPRRNGLRTLGEFPRQQQQQQQQQRYPLVDLDIILGGELPLYRLANHHLSPPPEIAIITTITSFVILVVEKKEGLLVLFPFSTVRFPPMIF